MLQELVLLLMVAMVVVSTVRKRGFARSRGGLQGDGGVALLLRWWGAIAAWRWVLVRLGGTCGHGHVTQELAC